MKKQISLDVSSKLEMDNDLMTAPNTTKNKGHKRNSSIGANSNGSTMSCDRYGIEPERMDWSVPVLTPQHKHMYNMCNKYKKEEAAMHFDYLAPNYEGMYLRMGWLDPKYVSDYVAKFATKNNWDHNVKIMDFACGTGLIGQYLSD